MKLLGFSVVVVPEGRSYSAWCPELDVASQGKTPARAIAALKEAVQLHLECLSEGEKSELKKRQGRQILTTLKVPLPA